VLIYENVLKHVKNLKTLTRVCEPSGKYNFVLGAVMSEYLE